MLLYKSNNRINNCTMEHHPKMQTVLHQLLNEHEKRNETNKRCSNCGSYVIDEQYTRYIFWNKYIFCSGWCMSDLEDDMRKNWRIDNNNK